MSIVSTITPAVAIEKQIQSKKCCLTCGKEFVSDDTTCPDDGTILTPLLSQSLVGTVLDKYEILEVIGAGGMGTVYKARHQLMKRIVAIKMVLSHLTSNSMTLRRFKQEAEATSALNHPNILTVHDFGVSPQGQPYLVMDYLEGTNLAAELEKLNYLPAERSLRIFIQTCAGLSHAHSKGVIHRDLKPSNIMLCILDGEPDFVKILDFGIAKVLYRAETDSSNLTQTGEIFGSPLYMSPEQCRGVEMDSRSDIYSLGCVMYRTLTGQSPLAGKDLLECMYKHVNEMAPPFSVASPDLVFPNGLEEVIFKCLSKDQADRYQSMGDLKADLENVYRQFQTGTGNFPGSFPQSATGSISFGQSMYNGNSVSATTGGHQVYELHPPETSEQAPGADAPTDRTQPPGSPIQANSQEKRSESTQSGLSAALGATQGRSARPALGTTAGGDMRRSDDGLLPDEKQLASTTFQRSFDEQEEGGRRQPVSTSSGGSIFSDIVARLGLRNVLIGVCALALINLVIVVIIMKPTAKLGEQPGTTSPVLSSQQSGYQAAKDEGDAAFERHQYEEAGKKFKAALELASREKAPAQKIAGLLISLCETSYLQNDYIAASQYLERAEQTDTNPTAEHKAKILNNRAYIYNAQGKYKAAQPLFKQALAIRMKLPFPERGEAASSMSGLGEIALKQGQYDSAIKLFKDAVSITEAAQGSDDPDVADQMNHLAKAYQMQGNNMPRLEKTSYRQAERLYNDSLAITTKTLGADHPEVGITTAALASLYFVEGKVDKSEEAFNKALAIQTKNFGENSMQVAEVKASLAILYQQRNDFQKAKQMYDEALSVARQNLESDDPIIQRWEARYNNLLTHMK